MRTTLELDPVRRHWNKRQASITGVMKGYANLPRATFDVIWVDSGLRVSVSAPGGTTISITIASFTMGTTWSYTEKKLQSFAPHVNVEAIQTFLTDS